MKNPLYLRQLLDLLITAVNRSVNADFLCLQVLDSGRSYLIYKFYMGRCAIPVRISGSSVVESKSTVLLLILTKDNNTMKNADVNDYLVDVYLESERILDPVSGGYDPEKYIKALELWWTRLIQSGQPINATNTHLILSLINVSRLFVDEILFGVDCKIQHNRLSELKSEVIRTMGTHLPQDEPEPAQEAA